MCPAGCFFSFFFTSVACASLIIARANFRNFFAIGFIARLANLLLRVITGTLIAGMKYHSERSGPSKLPLQSPWIIAHVNLGCFSAANFRATEFIVWRAEGEFADGQKGTEMDLTCWEVCCLCVRMSSGSSWTDRWDECNEWVSACPLLPW